MGLLSTIKNTASKISTAVKNLVSNSSAGKSSSSAKTTSTAAKSTSSNAAKTTSSSAKTTSSNTAKTTAASSTGASSTAKTTNSSNASKQTDTHSTAKKTGTYSYGGTTYTTTPTSSSSSSSSKGTTSTKTTGITTNPGYSSQTLAGEAAWRNAAANGQIPGANTTNKTAANTTTKTSNVTTSGTSNNLLDKVGQLINNIAGKNTKVGDWLDNAGDTWSGILNDVGAMQQKVIDTYGSYPVGEAAGRQFASNYVVAAQKIAKNIANDTSGKYTDAQKQAAASLAKSPSAAGFTNLYNTGINTQDFNTQVGTQMKETASQPPALGAGEAAWRAYATSDTPENIGKKLSEYYSQPANNPITQKITDNGDGNNGGGNNGGGNNGGGNNGGGNNGGGNTGGGDTTITNPYPTITYPEQVTPSPTIGNPTILPTIEDLTNLVTTTTQNQLPSNMNYDYDWGMNEYTDALNAAQGSLDTYTRQLLNQASDNDANSLYNIMRALRKSRASGLTSGASVGAQAANDLQALTGVVGESSALNKELLANALQLKYNLASKQADQPSNVLAMLNAYYTPQTEALSNVLGNYLYNGYGGQANANATNVYNSILSKLNGLG